MLRKLWNLVHPAHGPWGIVFWPTLGFILGTVLMQLALYFGSYDGGK